VCCGPDYSAAISDIGHLYTWGNGGSGKLGHGNTDDAKSPRLVKTLSRRPVVSVSCGTHHMAAVVAVPGVTAFIGYANQPQRLRQTVKTEHPRDGLGRGDAGSSSAGGSGRVASDSKEEKQSDGVAGTDAAVLARWGEFAVKPVHPASLSARSLRSSRPPSAGTRASRASSLGRSSRSFGSKVGRGVPAEPGSEDYGGGVDDFSGHRKRLKRPMSGVPSRRGIMPPLGTGACCRCCGAVELETLAHVDGPRVCR
jgi:hypothetical protein